MTKVQRYKVGFFSDEWGMSSITPCLIPDDSGYAVKFEDYCKRETELAALKAENESLKRDAERYRWMRENNWFLKGIVHLDSTIDAAMAQGEKG